jgi:hypothetical protein
MARDSGSQGAGAPKISRRTFIEGAIAASATAAGVSALAVAAATRASATEAVARSAAFKTLTDAQGRLLTSVVDLIVPASGAMPAAGDVGVARFIDALIVEAPHLEPPVKAGLDALGSRGLSTDTPGADGVALLEAVAASHAAAFDVLVRTTYVGYYSSPRVRTAIGWDAPHPTVAAGDVFDVSRLDDVRRRRAPNGA